jgi:hypothetical protein
MKRVLKIAIIVLAFLFIAAQFVRPDRTNPPINQAETLEASTAVPADVAAVMSRSCNDCHSHKTIYPWYSNVTPFNWFLANHISEARREMNFSVWNTYAPKKKAKKLEEICEQIEAGEMPLPSYLWIHRDAVLEPSQAKLLCDWAKAERSRIVSDNSLE